MYIIDFRIKNTGFKRGVETNNIHKVIEELPHILKRIEEDYFIEVDERTVVIDKIERFN